MKLSSLEEFYANKTIFITGASGFVGKVLLEKLLYSFSDVRQVLILMREKRGMSVEERLKKFKQLPVSENWFLNFTKILEDSV
jgi:alcohol-forming fatty acyl-CoA reductase